jgi:hypothetical protein
MRKAVLFISALILTVSSFAQIRKTPVAVTEAFAKKYPVAQDVRFEDNLVNVQVHFVLDSVKMIAKFDNDGSWKETEKAFSYDQLTDEVKDGFQKSKYSNEWKVKETSIIHMPDGSERYRLKVEKNDLLKKYLFFDKTGKLIRDSLTI